jgi:hypothetical protein
MSELDRVIPRWDVRTRRSIDVDAPPARIWRAVHETTMRETRVARLLFRVRGLPSAVDRGIFELEGFATIADEPERELVVGAVGKPWTPHGGLVAAADVATFDRPGYARMALNVTLGGVTLATETRVRCTDRRSHVFFRLYWLVVGPLSSVVRDDWLRAIKRRAERA